MCFNYKGERRLALGTTWCKVNLPVFCEVLHYFASDSLHMTPACSWSNEKFSAVLARLCKFYGVANRCKYSAGVSYSLSDPMV